MEVEVTVDKDDTASFTNKRGQKIVCRRWKCLQEDSSLVRAVVVIVHGFAEHCGVYDSLAKSLSSNGFYVAGHDHVGHGLSEGQRAYVTDYQDFVDDLLQHVDALKEKFPNAPVFLLGHSMGGCVSIAAILERPDQFAGAALIGPLVVASPDTATPVKVMLAKLLGWMAPQMGVAKLDSKFISRDPEVVKKYNEDPLNYHGKMRAGFAVAGLTMLNKLLVRLNEVCCPLLIMHGDQDKLCDISGSRILNNLASCKDKTLSIYEGGFHQIHNEPDGMGDKCRKEILDWLMSHSEAEK